MLRKTYHVDVSAPELDGLGGRDQLEGQDSEPRQSIFPTAGETPGRIDEADDVSVEGTIDWVQDSHFGQTHVGEQQHDTGDKIWLFVLVVLVR